MGLRIGTNLGALSALRNLRLSLGREAGALERLSTGRSINRASDDPSGLVLVEQFNRQLNAIAQAVDNTENATNVVTTAEAGLGEIHNVLSNLQADVIASLNTGVVGPEGRQALQNAIDQGVSAVQRIASTTRFGDQSLLNGDFGFRVTGADPQLSRIDVTSANFDTPFPVTVNVSVISAAARAQAEGTLAATQAAASKIRIRGEVGEAEISISAGASLSQVVEAINQFREATGVEATSTGVIQSTEVGSGAQVQITELEGDLQGITPGLTKGTDSVGQFNGVNATGRGNTLTSVQSSLGATVTIQPATTGNFSFTIAGDGATFQVGAVPGPGERVSVGISDVGPANLGASGGIGSLSTLLMGGTNSLQNAPGNALRILRSAVDEISEKRNRLGSVASQVFETNQRALSVQFENLSASRSVLADADFAGEVASFVRNQVVRRVGVDVLRQTGLNAGVVLRLLS